MASAEDARFRLRLAAGFLTEAQQDLSLERWRSCMDNSQLAVESAAKAILALLGPVGHTHGTAEPLRQAIHNTRFSADVAQGIARVIETAEQLGWDIHVASDYGDEIGRRTPWELFDESAAENALALASEALEASRRVVNATLGR